VTTDRAVVLTIDVGGSAVKASTISVADWRVLACVRREHHASYTAAGHMEFDPAAWWEGILAACRDAVSAAGASPGSYLGITCTGMRIPFVLLDGKGEAVAPGVLNLDRRGRAYLQEVGDALGRVRLYALTGQWLSPHFGLPKLLWFARSRPEVWKRVRHILQLHDWLLYRLCGEMASEPSAAAMGQIVDVASRTWAEELLAALDIPLELFPPLLGAGTVLGALRGEVARAIGVAPGTPVHVGGGDTHVAALGADAVDDGEVVVVGGSTTPIQLTISSPLGPSPGAEPLVSPHLWPGLWAAETNAGATGIMYTWLRGVAGGASPNGLPPYQTLDALASASPIGSNDVVVTAANPVSTEHSWSHLPPITIFGLKPSHTLGDVARAMLECTCHAVRANVEQLEAAAGARFPSVRLTGGSSGSDLFAQLLADVLGKRVCVPQVAEPSALAGGRIVLAGDRAAWGDPQPTVWFEPDEERSAAYARYGERYLAVYDRLREPPGQALGR
jgi:sugar (pentulose or hexulose) kinase